MKFCLIILQLILALLTLNAYAEINKWVDENNRVHYSDQPAPANINMTPVNVPPPAENNIPMQKSVAEREADLKKSQKDKEEMELKEAKQKDVDQAKQRYCEEARSNLLTLQNSPRISTYDSDGKLSYMDDATREKRMEEAQKGISKHCK